MNRIEIINKLIKKNDYKSYLEIGVKDPAYCFDLINCELKHGVDPGIESGHKVTFPITSDEFFIQNTQKYDIIFVDGLHLAEQSEKDILNSINFLNTNGTIVVHDCNPPDSHHAREDYYDHSTPAGIHWNGTVWKSIIKLRSQLINIHTSVVDVDWGVGIITLNRKNNPIHNWNTYYSFDLFEKNKNYFLNLISYEEFIKNYIL
jgi:hypothetical protein